MIIQVMRTIGTQTHKAIQLRVFQEIFVVKDVASKSGAGPFNLPSYKLFCLRPISIQLRIRGNVAQIIPQIRFSSYSR